MNDPLFIFYGIYVLCVGLCIGSFLNVVALRAFTGESIVLPPSKCPKCHNKLKWYHNIPVLSYVFLRGKCAFCKCKISIQYPIVEAFHGALYLLAFLCFGISLKTLFAFIFISFLTVFCITDIKEQVIFNHHFIPFIVIMFISSFFNINEINWYQALIAIVVAFLGFELIARVGYIFTTSRAFGEGDTYIAMGIGAFLGLKALCITFLLSIILQAIVAIPFMIVNSFKYKNYKLIKALFSAIFAVVMAVCFYFYSEHFNLIVMSIYLLIMLTILIYSLIALITDIKNKKENELFYMPFGPALAVGAVIVMFVKFIPNPLF